MGSRTGARVFVALGVVLRGLFFWYVARILPVSGDEQDYFRTTHHLYVVLTHLGSLGAPGVAESADRVIGNGWFMPGMTAVLLPVSLVTSNLALTRLYVGAINLGLYVLLVRRVWRVLGMRSATIVAAIGALSPAWVAFSFVLWGEMIAGQLAVLIVLHLVSVQRAIEAGRDPAWRWLALGGVLAVLVFVRPSFLLLLPALLLVVAALYLDTSAWWGRLGRCVRAGALTSLAFAAVLATWSVPLSRRMGGFYPTTTSTDSNLILAFAPPERWHELALPDPSQPSIGYERYLRREMARSGLSYRAVMREERRRMLSGVTLASYSRAAAENVLAYLGDENLFLDRFDTLTRARRPDARRARAWTWFEGLNTVVWYPCILLALVGLVMPWGLAGRCFWLAPALQLGLCVAAVQPFVSLAHGRHSVALLPLIGVGIAVALGAPGTWFLRAPPGPRTLGRRLLLLVQRAVSVLVLVAAGLVVWGALGA